MEERFTHKSRRNRGNIAKVVRLNIFKRDNFQCIYCKRKFILKNLTIDHLIPLSKGGLNEKINFVTSCSDCNQKKSNKSLQDFAEEIKIEIESLPVYGDPIIDNPEIPLKMRLLRKKLYDLYRKGKINLGGTQAQKKVETKFRRSFWQTEEGKLLEKDFPHLPGNVRIMIPEIRTYAKTATEFKLLIELAKSANTRNLINHHLNDVKDIENHITNLKDKTMDESLRKRLSQALIRFNKNLYN